MRSVRVYSYLSRLTLGKINPHAPFAPMPQAEAGVPKAGGAQVPGDGVQSRALNQIAVYPCQNKIIELVRLKRKGFPKSI
jgi:hypothetical protein